MINLFNIPTHNIDTSKFNNLLHGSIVTDFEQQFAEYVGAKYAVALNSATSAIFLLFLNRNITVEIPSMIPPVVANALITGGNKIAFRDDVDWVGDSYLLHDFGDWKVIDSAQKVERQQYVKEATTNKDVIIYSFYPTKPVSGCDGGMIVSNDKAIIDHIRCLSMNGMSNELNNWERKISLVGYKMYMNSLQAYIASENFKNFEQKQAEINAIREFYNFNLGLENESLHLYRIMVGDNKDFIAKAKERGIVCGIHYPALHLNPVYYNPYQDEFKPLIFSKAYSSTFVSIPFHEKLTHNEGWKVVEFIKEYNNLKYYE